MGRGGLRARRRRLLLLRCYIAIRTVIITGEHGRRCLHFLQHLLDLPVDDSLDTIVVVEGLLCAREVGHELEAMCIDVEFILMSADVSDRPLPSIMLESSATCCG